MSIKVLLLCGGEGTRFRPFSHTVPKQLAPVVNKPVLYHILEALARAGLHDVILLTGENKTPFLEAVGDGSRWGLRVTYVSQSRPGGLAHAVLAAEAELAGGPFFMYLGDNLLEEPLEKFLTAFQKNRPDSLVLLRKVINPQDFGVAEIEENRVVRVVEKPQHPRSNLALTGLYFFSPSIYHSIRSISPSARGELEITDAVQDLLDRGKRVEYRLLTGWWLDTGSPGSLLEAGRCLLKTIKPCTQGSSMEKTRVTGVLHAGPESRIENSRIIGPVCLGAGCQVKDSTLGPWVTVGDGGLVVQSRLENSILFPEVQVKNLTLNRSILGYRVKLAGNMEISGKPLQLLLGDDAVLQVPSACGSSPGTT